MPTRISLFRLSAKRMLAACVAFSPDYVEEPSQRACVSRNVNVFRRQAPESRASEPQVAKATQDLAKRGLIPRQLFLAGCRSVTGAQISLPWRAEGVGTVA